MKPTILDKFYPGIGNINERIQAEAVARANTMLVASNQLAGYVETTYRQLLAASNSVERV